MKFKTIAEAFEFYRNKTISEIETRAQEIENLIKTDANADVDALNIEAEGMNQAMTELRSQGNQGEKRSAFKGFNFLGSGRVGSEPAQGVEDPAGTPEYRSAFFKTMLGRQLTQAEQRAFNAVVETRSDAYSNISSAVAVIPTQTMNEVVRKARTMGGILSIARMFAVPAKMSLPVATPGSRANWNPEGATVESQAFDPTYVSFGANEMIKVLSISASVRKMSIPAFESYLVEELTNCVMEGLEYTAVKGSVSGGVNVYGAGVDDGVSITWTDGTNAVEYATTGLTYADVVSLISLLKRGYAKNAKFAMNNKTLYNQVYSLVDQNKRPIFIQDLQNDIIGKILGFEVVVDDNLDDGEIIFGDFNYLGVNMVDGIAIDVSTQSSFKAGRVDYRAMTIADSKVIVPEAFVKAYQGE